MEINIKIFTSPYSQNKNQRFLKISLISLRAGSPTRALL